MFMKPFYFTEAASRTHRQRFSPALAIALMLAAAASAVEPAASPPAPASGQQQSDIQSLREEIHELRQEVDQLREQKRAIDAATQPAVQAMPAPEAVQPSLDAAMKDAETHSRLMDVSGVAAGWNDERGFFLRSEDGSFVLSPFVLFQVRQSTAYRQDGRANGGDDTQTGFEIRRLQLGLDGNIITPDLTYRIFWQSSELTSGNLQLLMAWVQYRFHGTPWIIGGGQFKDPLDHEQLISDAKQLAVDRTFVDDQLAGGEAFSRGVTLRYDDHGPLRGEAAVTSGFNLPNLSFQQFPTNPANYGVAARGEYKLLGDWRDYEHFTSLGNHANLLVAGAGADYTEAGHTGSLRHVADVQFNPGPAGFYLSYLGRYTRGNTVGRHGDTYDPSARAQVSYLLDPRVELFGRYDYLHFDGREFAARTRTTVHEFTLGGNYYFHGQNAKFTIDLSYLPNGTPTADLGNELLANPAHAEVIGRAQFQLLL
jgi:hypothetical protein